MSDILGQKPMQFPPGSSGNGMVDGGVDDWKRLPDTLTCPDCHKDYNPLFSNEPCPHCEEEASTPFESIPDPVIQAGVGDIYEVLMTTQAIMEAILTMTEDQIFWLKDRLSESLEEFREEWI